jgi:uncharacterized protein DUF2513
MKRDMDLVRKILFKMEKQERFSYYSDYNPVKIDGYQRDLIVYHMKIMSQAGLLHVDLMERPLTPDTPVPVGIELPKIYDSYYSISWEGHEFLDASRDNKHWENAKAALAKAGGFVAPVAMQLLTSYIKTELKLP